MSFRHNAGSSEPDRRNTVNLTGQPYRSPQDSKEKPSSARTGNRIWVLIGIVAAFTIGTILIRQYLDLEFLAEQESRLKNFYETNPGLTYLVAFVIYVLVTGLSIPGAVVLSLLYAWFFGFTRGVILISFASTTGATVAFLISRYLFRDWIQNRFGERLKTINAAFDREGNFYLFLMRLIPAFPFFVVNAVMGLTKIRVITFWWVSQLGMLGGTAVYVYAGSRVPDLMTLKEKGIKAVFEPSQLIQISIAFALLGIFPIVAKKLATRFSKPSFVQKKND